jgi:tetratricopeptide (TPR) repeat protein
MENYRAAMDWCFISDHIEKALQLIGALGISLVDLGKHQEGEAWMEKILSSGQSFPRDKFLARAFLFAGMFVAVRDLAADKKFIEQALSISHEIGDMRGSVQILSELNFISIAEGNYEKGIDLLEQILQIYQQLGDEGHMAGPMIALGEQYYIWDYENYLDKARSLCEKGLEISQRFKLFGTMSTALNVLGTMEMAHGNLNKARALLEESVDLIKERINYPGLIDLRDSLGLAYYYLQDFASARTYFEWSIHITDSLSMANSISLCHLGYLLYRQGEQNQALYYLKETFRQLDCGDGYYRAIINGVLHQIPGVLLACVDSERAAKLYGFTDTLREKQKAFIPSYLRPDYERDLTETRRQLGEAAFAAAWDAGCSMTLEQAKACALEAKMRITEAPKVETQV